MDKDIVASAISPAFYFLDLFIQCFMMLIGVGFSGEISWFNKNQDDKDQTVQIQKKLEEDNRYLDQQVEIYHKLNNYFQFN